MNQNIEKYNEIISYCFLNVRQLKKFWPYMKVNELIQDISFMVRGSNLPSKEEIAQMTLNDKVQLEIEQDQIIQIFNQQALLQVWELKTKISQLIKEATALRATIIQNQKSQKNKEVIIKQCHKKNVERMRRSENDNQEANILIQQEHPLKKPIKVDKTKTQGQKLKTDSTIKKRNKVQINSLQNSNNNTRNKTPFKTNTIQPYRRRRVRVGFFDFV